MDQLQQLKKFTTVVADTGDFNSIKKYTPQDTTTNPSLILKAAKEEQYKYLIEEAVCEGKKRQEGQLEWALDQVFINFGKEILKIVPGRVSIEIDARLSFDVEGSIEKARKIIDLFEK